MRFGRLQAPQRRRWPLRCGPRPPRGRARKKDLSVHIDMMLFACLLCFFSPCLFACFLGTILLICVTFADHLRSPWPPLWRPSALHGKSSSYLGLTGLARDARMCYSGFSCWRGCLFARSSSNSAHEGTIARAIQFTYSIPIGYSNS